MTTLTLKELEDWATSPVSNDWFHDVFPRAYVLADQTRMRWYYYKPIVCIYCGAHSDYYSVVSLFPRDPKVAFKCDKCASSIEKSEPCSLITGRYCRGFTDPVY